MVVISRRIPTETPMPYPNPPMLLDPRSPSLASEVEFMVQWKNGRRRQTEKGMERLKEGFGQPWMWPRKWVIRGSFSKL